LSGKQWRRKVPRWNKQAKDEYAAYYIIAPRFIGVDVSDIVCLSPLIRIETKEQEEHYNTYVGILSLPCLV